MDISLDAQETLVTPTLTEQLEHLKMYMTKRKPDHRDPTPNTYPNKFVHQLKDGTAVEIQEASTENVDFIVIKDGEKAVVQQKIWITQPKNKETVCYTLSKENEWYEQKSESHQYEGGIALFWKFGPAEKIDADTVRQKLSKYIIFG
ncbi:MAG TPA: hypothetical protein VL401_02805 [Alphaproteobacteria bacterium]|jgi:hypothetical protein|nr:hypothetical protein [Alphaproteobacteria bacterium]